MWLGSPRSRRFSTLAFLIVLYVAHAWLVYGVLDGTISEWPWLYPAFAGISGTALLGMWTALSPRPLWLRLPNALLALMSAVAVLFWATSGQPPRFLEGLTRAVFVAFYVGSFVAAWVLWSIMRHVRGWRIVPLDAIDHPLPEAKFQVRLSVLFAETLLIAILLGLMRLAPAEYWGDLWQVDQLLITGLTTLCLVPVLAALVSIAWLVLAVKHGSSRLSTRAVLLAIALLAVSVGTLGVLSDRWEQFLSLSQMLGLAYLGAIMTLLLLKAGGYRLFAKRGNNAPQLSSGSNNQG